MRDGVLLVDKPPGPTSHDVVDAVRRQIGIRRVGHTGTLDPFASGLLVVLVGRATRLAQYLVGLPKSYAGTIRLGVDTDTNDRTGSVTMTSEAWSKTDRAHVLEAMSALTGCITQRPPVFSAKKQGGERAHRRARRGASVALAETEVEVTAFELERFEGSTVEFRADVGSGTYIRALARDLGARLGCGAHLEALRRISVGSFSVEAALPLAALRDGALALRPAVDAVPHLPQYEAGAEQRDAVSHGRPIALSYAGPSPVAVLYNGDLLAVAESKGGFLKPRVVLVDG